MSSQAQIVPLDTQTKWGKIKAVGWITGERYYWIIDKHGSVSMMPADVVEAAERLKGGK